MADTARSRILAAQDAVAAVLDMAEQQGWDKPAVDPMVFDAYKGLRAAAWALDQVYPLIDSATPPDWEPEP